MSSAYEEILRQRVFAVTGVSRDPRKFGHIIFYFLKRAGYEVYAVNPNADCITGEPCYASLADVPIKPDVVVTVTQPWITAATVRVGLGLGITRFWMQPGSESRDGIRMATEAGATVVHGGPCIMVEARRIS